MKSSRISTTVWKREGPTRNLFFFEQRLLGSGEGSAGRGGTGWDGP